MNLSLEDLQRAVVRLPVDARQVFLAHCVHGKPYQQVAQELGIPRGTVGTRLLRARRLLRRLLTQALEERGMVERGEAAA
jgi:RNA polymerase sigma-70 factor (ECF subfamily)